MASFERQKGRAISDSAFFILSHPPDVFLFRPTPISPF
jgi:hypothetical protein